MNTSIGHQDLQVSFKMKKLVTVVDDSALARKMLIKALPPDWEVEVHQASNGLEALEACRAGKAEVMFLDLQMPVMDGYTTLDTLKQEGLTPLVFVVSADIQPEAQRRVLSSGASEFVKKPVNGEIIMSMLQKHGVV